MRIKLLLTALLMSICCSVWAQQIVLTPQWIAQSQFAGYYAAQELGYYEQAGLDVVIEHISASEPAMKRMNDGRCNAITMQLTDALYHIERGMSMVNVLQTAQRSGLVIIPRRSNITKLKDLQGRRVGIWRANFSQVAQFLDHDHRLNIEWVPFIQSINLYVSGAIDATIGMIYNELYLIKASGFENVKEIRFNDVGYNYPEDGLYVSAKYYAKYPDKAKAFAEASRRGWLWVHENPEEALDIVIQRMKRENMPYNINHQRWMLEQVLRLQSEADGQPPSFILDANKVVDLSNVLRAHGRISTHFTLDKLQGN